MENKANKNCINRTEIANQVFFSSVTDSRFKMNKINIMFLSQLDEEKASLNAIIPNILSKSNEKYKTLAALNNKLSALYAAQLYGMSGKLGDTQYMGLSMTVIDDRYSLDNEPIISEAIGILSDCLFAPNIVGGEFPRENVELEKQNQIDAINSELNDKQVYASNRANKLMCNGEPFSFNPNGTVEMVRKVNGKALYQAYKDMLSSCQVEIICAGCNDFVAVKEKLTKAFCALKRENISECASIFSPLKEQPVTEVEKMPVTQSKLVIGFKSDSTDRFANSVMSAIYGGTVTSKLFLNVREKLSLCYYCWSGINHNKGLMLVKSGVEDENVEKAKDEILKQFEDMKSGNFSDEEFENAIMTAANDYKTVNDSIGGILHWYFAHIYDGNICTPEESLEHIKKVTRDEVIKAANSFKLDSIYILTGEDKESE